MHIGIPKTVLTAGFYLGTDRLRGLHVALLSLPSRSPKGTDSEGVASGVSRRAASRGREGAVAAT